jgi:thiamine-phosphate diphosphorylase
MAVVSELRSGLSAGARGATVIQLRSPASSARQLFEAARALVQRQPLPVVVSARIDVALAAGAAGVHLPERDLPPAAARHLLGGALLGRSVHSLAGARAAAEEGADYVVYGPVFVTRSHSERTPVGLDALARLAAAVPIPVLAIGGVDRERAAECLTAGAAGYAAISAFQEAP